MTTANEGAVPAGSRPVLPPVADARSGVVRATTLPMPRQAVARTATKARTRSRRLQRPGGWTIAGWIFMVGLILYAVVPMLWMVSTSLKSEFAATEYPPRWIPEFPTIEQYRELLNPTAEVGQTFLRYLVNSLWVSIATTLLGLVVGVPAAYAFSRFSFPGKDALFFGVLFRNMFPAVVFLIPLFILMRNLGLIDTHAALIITYLTFGLPLSIWLLKGFYDNIPVELEMAARIDGATRWQAFRLIVMPLSSPGIIATAIYAFIQAWNEYIYARTLINREELMTMPVGLGRFFTEYASNWPGLMAASFIMSIPVVVLFLLLQRYFVQALTEGAVKH
ncbi:MAG: Maltodextrin ABC transporter, permease protein MdxG [uncultured Thermomicrobiales bacterium]|uniref:Maltodextrin ABC transporter, permease protein MdxG n=1 Tax=uncultured Thermomicrobiales bacterium TaxID=1645740 RepID=A0A6J4UKT5_9BACT|nr:MAG: Maltodextrin ABC transporter, permease protein MdxG [uncultured Thermomicrobiales bacterium]